MGKCHQEATDHLITVPSGIGERSILSHVVSIQTELLDGCMLPYRGSKSNKSADYHSEMNWNVLVTVVIRFRFLQLLLEEKNAFLGLDRATYHR